MRLSIVDLAPVPAGGTAADALRNSVELAQTAERLGYARFWVAEHHGRGETFASSTPEVMVAHVAAATRAIRVGSGGVLLNHYSPYKVAETFRVLHALHPGRIDMGFGRADGLPVADHALRQNRDEAGGDEPGVMAWLAAQQQVEELVAWLDDGFPTGHPFATIPLLPGVADGPEPWLLGASLSTAVLAGRLGLRFCFAGFLNPEAAVSAIRSYRQAFTPVPAGPEEPQPMLALNVCCGETDADGDRLRATVELFHERARRGDVRREPLPDPDQALAELGGPPEPSARHISGGPDRVRRQIEQLAEETGIDEIMVQDLIARPTDRLRSYTLLAEAVGRLTGDGVLSHRT